MEIVYWSDYACPYCYIGETRLRKALEKAGLAEDTTLRSRAFQLDINAPQHATGDTTSRYAAKYGQTHAQAAASVEHISELGQEEGLNFDYAATRFTNTMDAHRLTKLAQSKQDPKLTEKLSDLLFRAYFTEGKELADHAVLLEAGLEAGLAEDEIQAVLNSDAYLEDVRQDEADAALYGVHGVPYFILDGALAVPGALTIDDFVDVLTEQLPQVKALIAAREPAGSAEA